jgi:hypothetical protein
MAEINSKIDELIEKFIKNAEEERDLALERYRRQDVMIETAEDFVVQGKNAVEFLKTAAQRSDAILYAIKVISNVSGQNGGSGANAPVLNGDDLKRQIKDMVNKEVK